MKPQKETFNFQTEVNQLLHLMVHSLYSNKDIFLRELISNSSDAADKLRFEALSDEALLEGDAQLKIYVEFDSKKKTITVTDNGIGMTRDEVIGNLGTIAKSGTREFLERLSGEQAKDEKLIGQFGVGFYSCFMVSDNVIVETRRAGLTPEHGVRWESKGEGGYSIENIEKETRGTTVILYLKKEAEDYLDHYRLSNIITTYSDHIAIPIYMKKILTEDEKKAEKQPEWEQINRAQALWTLPKNKIKESDYQELYKHISHDFENPLTWIHNKVEGKLEYISLLYIPTHAPFDLWHPEHQHGLKLYIKRVFIMDDAKQFLPNYLRFVKGVIDTNDLPLNISREILQKNPTTTKIRAALIKRILDLLEDLAKNDLEKYQKFWSVFGKVMKEGPAEDFENREQIAKLLRFASTDKDTDEQCVSLEDYIKRMKEGQDKIYYITAENFMAAKNSPNLEIFRKKGIEVLLLFDRIDEWLVSHLTEFDKKSLVSVSRGDLDLGNLVDKEEKQTQEKEKETFEATIKQVKEILGERVKDVRLTHRLTDSPACIVADYYDMNVNMQRILQSLGQPIPEAKPIFELNPDHAMIQRLKNETDKAQFKEWTQILFDQAILAEGGQLKDPASFVSRLNKLLMQLK
ncbi:MAG: molecular chaperone HtpG [Gammaproteobacteria bacterium]|nr:molecular chaperone HtpG [Gammaproteobacteria bacterium]